MTRLLFANIPNTSVSDFECQKESPSIAITTIGYFKKKYRYANLHYIVSADAANGFVKWFKYQEILSKVRMIIMPRRGFDLTDDAKKLFNTQSASFIKADTQEQSSDDASTGPISVNGITFHELSSTDIRNRLCKNEPLDGCLTPQVMAYIEAHQLYGYKKRDIATLSA